MYSQTQINPALAALMQTAEMVTQDQKPTVAAQLLQEAQQKSQPQQPGIAALMPGAKQQANQMAQAAQPATQGDIQQLQQRMQQQAPQGAGVAGLPAPNMQSMGMASGGVVGFAGTDEFGSFVSNPEAAAAMDELRVAEIARKKNEEKMRQQLEFLEQSGAGGSAAEAIAALRAKLAPPPEDMGREGMRKPAPSVAAQSTQQAPAKKPSAAPSSATVSKPTAGVADLIKRPELEDQGVATAGSEFVEQGKRQQAAIRDIAARKEAAIKGMPDLNAEGIAALQRANEERRRLLAQESSDDSRKRWAGIFRGWGQEGDRGAYDRAVSGIAQRDSLANQAQLGHEQATIKLKEAQQAKALGEFDRAQALEIQAAELENKARDDMLKARQIASQLASSKFATQASLYGADVSARERTADRMQEARLKGAELQQRAEQNNQMTLANRINAANITVNSAIEKAEKTLENKYPMMKMMTPELLSKNPQLAATYENYVKDKNDLYKQTVEPSVMERNRLAAMVSGGNISRYDAQGNPVR